MPLTRGARRQGVEACWDCRQGDHQECDGFLWVPDVQDGVVVGSRASSVRCPCGCFLEPWPFPSADA